MGFPGNLKEAFIHNRLFRHVLFWLVAIFAFTAVYSNGGIPGFGLTLVVICLSLPAHLLYFYAVTGIGMPRLLFRKKYASFFIFLILVMLAASLIFRLTEILVVDPMIFNAIKKNRPDFIWPKLQGSFSEQLRSGNYFVAAIEQTNIVVWIGIAVKFFSMWYERRQAALQAELDFLKAQVHPHFLFNTLNNLYALTLQNSPRSPAIVLGLSEILRYMLYECNEDKVLLKRDIGILQSYITLEKLRYEERLDLSFSINGEINGQQIAPLLILPLLENAFKHGVSEDTGVSWININLQVNGNILKFKIANSKPSGASRHQGRIGVGNVRKRLELLYPSAHQLRIIDEEDTFLAVLEINL